MIGARFGHFLDRPLYELTRRISVNPSAITVAGFAITSAGALLLTRNLFWGGLVVLFGSGLDMLDGIVARNTGRSSSFGAFLDSFLDRVSDIFIFCALAWYLADAGSHTGSFLSIGALLLSLLISYIKARAEGLGLTCNVGIMERPERIVLVVFGAITGWVLPVLWIIFVLSGITVYQRLRYIWRQCVSAA